MIYEEIYKNFMALSDISKQTQMLITPHPADKKRMQSHEKKLQLLADQHKEKCFGIERHLALLNHALVARAGGNISTVSKWVEEANQEIPMDPWFAAQMADRKDQEQKSKKELPGQLTIHNEIAEQQMSKGVATDGK